MERLTEHTYEGAHLIHKVGVRYGLAENVKLQQAAIEKLAAYEDTEMEPEEAARFREKSEEWRSAYISQKSEWKQDVEKLVRAGNELENFRALGTVEHFRELLEAEQRRQRGGCSHCTEREVSIYINGVLRENSTMRPKARGNFCEVCGRDLKGGKVK